MAKGVLLDREEDPETRKRRKFTAAFKSTVVPEALCEERPIPAIASRHRVHPNQVSSWKRKAMEGLRVTI